MPRIKRSNTYYGSGNPGDAYNDPWATPKYVDPKYTLPRYGQSGNTFSNMVAQKRGLSSINNAQNFSEFRKDKIDNRSEVLTARKLSKLGRAEERLEAIQGKPLSKRQRIKLGKGGRKAVRLSKRIRNRAQRKKNRTIRRGNLPTAQGPHESH